MFSSRAAPPGCFSRKYANALPGFSRIEAFSGTGTVNDVLAAVAATDLRLFSVPFDPALSRPSSWTTGATGLLVGHGFKSLLMGSDCFEVDPSCDSFPVSPFPVVVNVFGAAVTAQE